MKLKIACGVIAMLLVIAFLAPPLLKLKDAALAAVMLFGVGLIALDLWQSIYTDD
jgi:hypothetical protein